MFSLPILQRISSAHAVFFGRHGDVTRLAHERCVYRQTLYREAHAAVRVLDPQHHAEILDTLHCRISKLEGEVDQLRRQQCEVVRLDTDKHAEFAATGQALGVSLTTVHALLAIFLGTGTPSLSRLGRLTQAAGRRASAALAAVDEATHRYAKQVAADEIFVGRRPVLMTIEQHSLCWLGGRLTESREGQEWAKEFALLPALEQVTRDGGQGLQKGLELVNTSRQKAGQSGIADQEDHFHLLHRGRRALREVQAKATRAFRKAEKADAALRRDRRRGKVGNGRHSVVARRWRQAEQAFDRWSAQERSYEKLRAALRLFTPTGELNTPERAEAETRAALAELTGPEWSRLRTRLVGPKAFTYLAQVRQQLSALPVAEELRAAALRIEGLKRQPEALRREEVSAGALRGVLLAATVVLSLSKEAGERAWSLVRGVLAGAWRSSSLVEGLNSVLRMQQRRQKRLTQGLLDLKRLCWNAHVFIAGKRKGKSPYEHLGLKLPPGSWWELLNLPPEQLRQQVSALNQAA